LSAEALLRRKNREFFPAEIRSTVYRKDGEVVSVTSLVRDITERKKVEEALKDSEEKFRNLMEQSPFSIQIIKPDGRVDQFNKAFMDLWGISEETLPEVLEKYNVFEDEEAKKLGVMPLIEKACRGETVILPEIEYDAHRTMENLEIVSTGSKKVWIKVRLYPIKNSNGEVVNVVFIEEDITDRKQAEREILRYHERLKALASQLTVTEEKERRRIAADLHDHVGQSLALARMQIDSAKKSAADDRLAARLDEISENLRKAIHDTRHLIFDLSPPAMHQIGLGAAVSEWLEEQIEKRYGIKTEFFDNIEQRYRKTLDDNVRAILFRNVRELLINVVKHAQANQVSVSMEITDGALKTVIQDNGIGFDQSSEIQNVKSEEGFGLFSIKERMADLGGALKIESQPGKGCKAVLTVPLSIDDDKEIL
jgi:PAS domain S-box-containing protein